MKAVLTLVVLCAALMGAGRVETRDGRILHGRVTFDDGAIVLQAEAGAQPVRLEAADLRSVSLDAVESRPLVGTQQKRPAEPWTGHDIGNVHQAGSAECDASGELLIRASGWGPWSDGDSLHFVHHPLTGDGQVLARLRGVDSSHGPFVAGIMIRQDLDPSSAMVFAAWLPNGQIRVSRRVPGQVLPPGTFCDGKDAQWLRLARRGDEFTTYVSADGKTWRQVDTRTVPMGPGALAGIAAWSTANSAAGQATVDSVMLISGTAGTPLSLTDTGAAEAVVLRDGTAYGGVVEAVDAQSLLLGRGVERTKLARERIARILFGPPPLPLDSFAGKTGVLLLSGDFVEGEVLAVTAPAANTDPRVVSVQSLVFGIRQVPTAEVAAVLLADVSVRPAAWRVRTADGSVLYGDDLRIGKTGVSLDDRTVEAAAFEAIEP